MKDMLEATGTVWAVFGHRFAVEGAQGRVLADLGPRGAEIVSLAPGDVVSFAGERRPSEIKVRSLTLADGSVREIEWPGKHPPGAEDHHAPADPAVAVAAVRARGYVVEGEPKRKPKHFEVVGSKDGERCEIHVELGGAIRKTKPLAA